MATTKLTKITEEELIDKRLEGLADTPGLSALAMQQRFDAHPDRNTEVINLNANAQDLMNEDFEARIKKNEEELPNKVDKVIGKGLSDENYSAMEKAETAKVKDKLDASVFNEYKALNDEKVNKKVDSVLGMGLSEANFTNTEKEKIKEIDKKQNAEPGKGLSEADFTSAEKAKLLGIEDGANNYDDTDLRTRTDAAGRKANEAYSRTVENGNSITAVSKDVETAVRTATSASKEARNAMTGVSENASEIDWLRTELTLKQDRETGKGLSEANFTKAEKDKLFGIEGHANNYSLPVAESGILGGVMPGRYIGVTPEGNLEGKEVEERGKKPGTTDTPSGKISTWTENGEKYAGMMRKSKYDMILGPTCVWDRFAYISELEGLGAAVPKLPFSGGKYDPGKYGQTAVSDGKGGIRWEDTGDVYGVRFLTGSNEGETVKRLYMAEGKTASAGTDTEKAANDFDSIYPWSEMKRCCGSLNTEGKLIINAYKGEPGYAEDGSNGEVWVEIPLFWYKHTYGSDGSEEMLISQTKKLGFLPSPIAVNQGSFDKPARRSYIPAYPLAFVDGKPTSRSGVFSDYDSLNNFMAKTKEASPSLSITTAEEAYTMLLLEEVEFATRNMQKVMYGYASVPYNADYTALEDGTGVNFAVLTANQADKFAIGNTICIGTSLGNVSVAKNRIITGIENHGSNKKIIFDGEPVNVKAGNIVFGFAAKNGSCDGVISSSGSPVSNSDGLHNCIYRGIETPYGSAFNWLSNVLLKRTGEGTEASPYEYEVYYLPDTRDYATNGGDFSKYIKLNLKLPQNDGYVKRYGTDARYPFIAIPTETGAGSTTYHSDYYYHPRYEVTGAFLFGRWSHGSTAGPSYWYCGYHPSDGSINQRARLSYKLH